MVTGPGTLSHFDVVALQVDNRQRRTPGHDPQQLATLSVPTLLQFVHSETLPGRDVVPRSRDQRDPGILFIT